MRLVFIYGPPASGKLTVAKELAKMTGFRLFDNHVSIRFVTSLFDFGTQPFSLLIGKIRTEMITEAAKEGIDTIFTFVYETESDDRFVRQILRIVKLHGGRVLFVRLQCERRELERRVGSKSRRAYGKLATRNLLRSVFSKYDLDHEIPFQTSLTIDTTHLSPRRAGKTIVQHYHLRTLKKP
jgi:hypothetical protein